MLGRFALIGVSLLALGAPSVLAGPGFAPIWLLKKTCAATPGLVKQCAYQFVKGNRNEAITKQTTVQYGLNPSTQFSAIFQKGNDNIARTVQTGSDQSAKTIQVGNNNQAYIYQEGEDQKSSTVQIGSGIWTATSSIGEDTKTSTYSFN